MNEELPELKVISLKEGMKVISMKSLKEWEITKDITIVENGKVMDKDFIESQIKSGKYEII
jgi:hypothetical protein